MRCGLLFDDFGVALLFKTWRRCEFAPNPKSGIGGFLGGFGFGEFCVKRTSSDH